MLFHISALTWWTPWMPPQVSRGFESASVVHHAWYHCSYSPLWLHLLRNKKKRSVHEILSPV
jgi:hypothetical protein